MGKGKLFKKDIIGFTTGDTFLQAFYKGLQHMALIFILKECLTVSLNTKYIKMSLMAYHYSNDKGKFYTKHLFYFVCRVEKRIK